MNHIPISYTDKGQHLMRDSRKNPTSSLPKKLREVLPKVLSEVLHQEDGRRRKARKGEEGKHRQVAGIQKVVKKCSKEEGLGLDRVGREVGLENGQMTASEPESNQHLLTEVLPEVLLETSFSLSHHEKLIRLRLLKPDGIIKDSQHHQAATPPNSVGPEVSTAAETGGKVQ